MGTILGRRSREEEIEMRVKQVLRGERELPKRVSDIEIYRNSTRQASDELVEYITREYEEGEE